jgi:hypothetical protein
MTGITHVMFAVVTRDDAATSPREERSRFRSRKGPSNVPHSSSTKRPPLPERWPNKQGVSYGLCLAGFHPPLAPGDSGELRLLCHWMCKCY